MTNALGKLEIRWRGNMGEAGAAAPYLSVGALWPKALRSVVLSDASGARPGACRPDKAAFILAPLVPLLCRPAPDATDPRDSPAPPRALHRGLVGTPALSSCRLAIKHQRRG